MVDHLGGPAFRRLFVNLTGEQQEEIRKILAIAGGRDLISIGFALDESIKTAVNELLQRANALRSGRIAADTRNTAIERAAELEERAPRRCWPTSAATFLRNCS